MGASNHFEQENHNLCRFKFLGAEPELSCKVGTARRAVRGALGERALPPESRRASPHAVLLYGVTGSGKTEVYLQAIDHVLSEGQGAIVLVPEISLTPQTVARCRSRFGGQIAVLHSHLGEGERHDEWHRIRSAEARIVIGARSAVFAPVGKLGLVIVDEEQDGSYKQEETPRYNGRDLAVLRARESGAVVLLGSATPSLESFHQAHTERYRLLRLGGRIDGRPLPEVEIVDMRDEFREAGKVRPVSRVFDGEGDHLAHRCGIIHCQDICHGFYSLQIRLWPVGSNVFRIVFRVPRSDLSAEVPYRVMLRRRVPRSAPAV